MLTLFIVFATGGTFLTGLMFGAVFAGEHEYARGWRHGMQAEARRHATDQSRGFTVVQGGAA